MSKVKTEAHQYFLSYIDFKWNITLKKSNPSDVIVYDILSFTKRIAINVRDSGSF